jgi:hypothetical protein
VGDAAHEEDLLLAALLAARCGLLRADVDLGVAADGGEALQVVVGRQARQLQELGEGRAHVAAERVLLEVWVVRWLVGWFRCVLNR